MSISAYQPLPDLRWKLAVQTALLLQARIAAGLITQVKLVRGGHEVNENILKSMDEDLEKYFAAVQEAMDLSEKQIKALEDE